MPPPIIILGVLMVATRGISPEWPSQPDAPLFDFRIDVQEEPSGVSRPVPTLVPTSVHTPKEIDPVMIAETLKRWGIPPPRLLFFKPVDEATCNATSSPRSQGTKRPRELTTSDYSGIPIPSTLKASPINELAIADKQFGLDLLITNPLMTMVEFEAAMRANNQLTNPDRIRRFYRYHAVDEVALPRWLHRFLRDHQDAIILGKIEVLAVGARRAFERMQMTGYSGMKRRILDWDKFCLAPLAAMRSEEDEPPCALQRRGTTGSMMVLSEAQRRLLFIQARATL